MRQVEKRFAETSKGRCGRAIIVHERRFPLQQFDEREELASQYDIVREASIGNEAKTIRAHSASAGWRDVVVARVDVAIMTSVGG